MEVENKNDDANSSNSKTYGNMTVTRRKNISRQSSTSSSLRGSYRSSSARHTIEEQKLFAPDLHADPAIKVSIHDEEASTESFRADIDTVSETLRNYHAETGVELAETPIIEAYEENSKNVEQITKQNQQKEKEQPQNSPAIIASAKMEEEVEEGEDEFDPVAVIKSLPPYESLPINVRNHRILPPKPEGVPKFTLVLDLDETLVHCTTTPIPDADLTFPICFQGSRMRIFAKVRPFFFFLLKRMSPFYEIIIFTASQECYANELLNIVDPEHRYISHRLFRNSCLEIGGNYIKDLNVLNRDLATTVIVDNYISCFGYQIDNGIPIISWFDDKTDHELYNLTTVLYSFLKEPDVRPCIRQLFHLRENLAKFNVIV